MADHDFMPLDGWGHLEDEDIQVVFRTSRPIAGAVERGIERGDFRPVVPLFVRDTPKTVELVKHLRAHGVLATGLNFPVVPKGDETIRFQLSADHTAGDVDQVLGVLAAFPGR